MITVYSKPNCPHCTLAKEYLTSVGIRFEQIDVTQNEDALAFVRSRGHKTVPQIYVGQTLFVEGGNDGIRALTAAEIIARVEEFR